MSNNKELVNEIRILIEKAYGISKDVGNEVEQMLSEGVENPLSETEAKILLNKVIIKLRNSEVLKTIPGALKTIEGEMESVIEGITAKRTKSSPMSSERKIKLQSFNGIEPSSVKPVPMFHARPVQMISGYVDTNDINLWLDNDRLQIHKNQFNSENNRNPRPEEILDIMFSRLPLKGIPDKNKDQFKIINLAQSIAINGVRKPPIIDINGDLLDGNRRVAACYYILNSNDFSPDQKKLASKIHVWQLTDHATNDDRRAVVVSLNFEPDNKLEWSAYLKANRLYEDWQAILSVEPRDPGPRRAAFLKRELSEKYALGSNTTDVNRYLKMVSWANEFKEYHESQNRKDKFEVEHHTEKYFQYFDELSVGQKTGGVAHTLNQSDSFKNLVYDLLYDGKFKNWTQIRLLKHHDEAMHDSLADARKEEDLERAKDIVEDALADAKLRKRESRVVGANPRIKTFVRWLERLPISAFRDEITKDNLVLLLNALKLVEKQIADQNKE